MTHTRRDFLRFSLRVTAATGVATGLALLVMKQQGNDSDCVRPLTCDDCAKYRDCLLTKATRFRSQQTTHA